MSVKNIFFVLVVGFFSLGAYAMGGKVMFSAVTGQVLQNGKPLAGVKVVRQYTWAWNDKKVVEEVVTDAAGSFSFKQASQSSLLTSIVPHEPVIYQTIHIFHNDKKYVGWRHTKHNYDSEGELRRPISIVCDLAIEPEFYMSPDVFGVCKQK